MTAVSNTPAYNAFENQLKTLCLKEFPCGLGKWREKKELGKHLSKVEKKKLREKDLPEQKFVVTLRDFGSQHEKTDNLEELVTAKHSIWNLDYSWSNEAKELREIAVRSPWLIDDNFVFDHFKTLRITDKGVTEVDEKLLHFRNLEELTLSANFLKCVNSRNLPASLKVLELCANQIWSLQELVIRPPGLIHLGLGHNQLSMVDDYITGHFWPQLLSLDLSHNNLCDLMDIVKKLTTLPKLRNLILMGNPLALVAGYRGYTIDSLRQLDILDDIPISADERHHFKGLAKRREYILDEAKVQFKVDFIRGIPMPEEMRNPDDQPEYPIISRKYYVQFLFLEDKSTPAVDMLQMLQRGHGDDDDDFLSATTPSHVPSNMPPIGGAGAAPEYDRPDSVAVSDMVPPGSDVSKDPERNVNFAQNLETLPNATLQVSGAGSVDGRGRDEDSVYDAEEMQHKAQSMVSTPVKLIPIKSTAVEWAEEMEVSWSEWFARDDLLHMRDFLKKGMDMAVMEEKVESFPAPEEAEETGAPSPTGSKAGGKGGKGGKPDKKDDKKKAQSAKGKERPKSKSADRKKDDKKGGKGAKKDTKKGGKASGKDGKDGKKKKKGEPEVELAHMPPEYTTIATFHIPLEDFLDGDFLFENVFHKASAESGATTPASSDQAKKDKKDKKKKPESGKKDKKDKKDKPDKKGKESPKDAKGAKKKERGKSPKATDKKGDKSGGKDKKSSHLNVEDDEEPPPPPPLECHVAVKLHHWRTAMDSLKDETTTGGTAGKSEATK